jgi:hypothetical protein
MRAYTLTQLAAALDEPQHRLLHLCKKRVVVPALGEAHGRGSSRQFSSRNAFEFAVALELRALGVPVLLVAGWVRALAAFALSLDSRRPALNIPDDLVDRAAPRLAIVLIDDDRLLLTIGDPSDHEDALDVPTPSKCNTKRVPHPRRIPRSDARRLMDGARTLLQLDLTKVAQRLASRLAAVD